MCLLSLDRDTIGPYKSASLQAYYQLINLRTSVQLSIEIQLSNGCPSIDCFGLISFGSWGLRPWPLPTVLLCEAASMLF